MQYRNMAALLAALFMVLGACGGGGDADPGTTDAAGAPTTQPSTTEAQAATTTTAAPTSTTTTTTTTTTPASVCPSPPELPPDAVVASTFDAGDGRTVDVVESPLEANPSLTETLVRVTYADGGAADLTRDQVQLHVLGFFDVNQDGSDELFLLNRSAQLRLWIVIDADCELNVADSTGAPLGAAIPGGGEALLIASLETDEVSAGVACLDGKIRTHFFFIDPSPSMEGMARVDFNEAELVGNELVVVATDRPTLPLEEAQALLPLDCGDLSLPEAG